MRRRKLSDDIIHKTKFIMKGNPHLHFKKDTIVDFKTQIISTAPPKHLKKPAFPVFSNDMKYYTPSFVLSITEEPKDQDCLLMHNQKVEQSLTEIEEDEIMIPKPSANSQFCGVCIACFEDYLEHIHLPQHLKHLADSKYQKQILALCYYFAKCIKQPTEDQLIKRTSTQTKINQDQSWTQFFIDQKKVPLQNR